MQVSLDRDADGPRMGVPQANRGLDRPLGVAMVFHIERDRRLDLRGTRHDPLDQVERVAAVDIQPELRQLHADVRG